MSRSRRKLPLAASGPLLREESSEDEDEDSNSSGDEDDGRKEAKPRRSSTPKKEEDDGARGAPPAKKAKKNEPRKPQRKQEKPKPPTAAAKPAAMQPMISMRRALQSKGEEEEEEEEEDDANPAAGANSVEFSQLVQELAEAHHTLSTMEQRADDSEAISEPLARLTKRIASEEILSSRSSRVRMFAARCLVDILFLHAPDPPFEDATIKHAFRVLIGSLRGLAQEESTEASVIARYVLSRMALCRLGCVLVDIPEKLAGDGGVLTSELVLQMFETTFNSIAALHPPSVEQDAVNLLAGYLDELPPDEKDMPEGIFPVLDCVLGHLLPDQRKQSHRAYDVARGVIKKSVEKIRGPVSTLINAVLLGDMGLQHVQDTERMCVKDSIHECVLELFVVEPNLLIRIIPSFEQLLEVDDLESKRKALKLFCDIFLEMQDGDVAEYETLLMRVLKLIFDPAYEIRFALVQFVGRCGTRDDVSKRLRKLVFSRAVPESNDKTLLELGVEDKEVDIRKEAVEICSLLLTRTVVAAAAATVSAAATTDKSRAAGRKGATTTTTSSSQSSGNSDGYEASASPTSEEENVFGDEELVTMARSLCGRLHDASIEIALRAMEGLSWAYSKNRAILTFVPEAIFRDDAVRENREDVARTNEMRIHLLDQALLATVSERASSGTTASQPQQQPRAKVLVQLFASLTSPRAKACFLRLVMDTRARVRKWVMATNVLRRASKTAASSAPTTFRISPDVRDVFPNVEDATVHALWTLSDNRIYDRWTELTNPATTRTKLGEVRKDLSERVGACLKSSSSSGTTGRGGGASSSASATAEAISACKNFVKSLCRWAGLWTLCGELETSFLLGLGDLPKSLQAEHIDLVEHFARALPEMFQNKACVKVIHLKCSADEDEDDVLAASATAREFSARLACCTASCVGLGAFPDTTKQLRKLLVRIALGPVATSSKNTGKAADEEMASSKRRKPGATAIPSSSTSPGIVHGFKMRKRATYALLKLQQQSAEAGGGDNSNSKNDDGEAGINDDQERDIASYLLARLLHQSTALQPFSSGDLYVVLAIAKGVPERALDATLMKSCLTQVMQDYRAKKGVAPSEEDVRVKVACIKLLAEDLLKLRSNEGNDRFKRELLCLRRFVADAGDPWSRQKARQEVSSATSSSSSQPNQPPRQVAVVDTQPDSLSFWPPPAGAQYVELRLAAASALMKIEAVLGGKSEALQEGKDADTMLSRSAMRFLERSRLAFDPDPSVRERFLAKVTRIELERGIQMARNGALLAIVAARHEGKGRNRAAKDLTQLLKALADKSRQAQQNKDEAKATLISPEMVLPNLVYLLAHHPQFPYEDKPRNEFLSSPDMQHHLTRPLVQYYESLLAAHGRAKNKMDVSVSFMLSILAGCRQRQDAVDGDDKRIHAIGDLARLVIQKVINYSPHALEPYKGRTPLPKIFVETRMARLSTATTAAGLPEGDEENAEPALAPKTPTGDARASMSGLSPIPYLPEGFELLSMGARSGRRKRPSILDGQQQSSLLSSSSGGKKRKSLAREEESEMRKARKKEPRVPASRSQPSRSARASIVSYAESPSDEDEDDEGSYSSDSGSDDDQ